MSLKSHVLFYPYLAMGLQNYRFVFAEKSCSEWIVVNFIRPTVGKYSGFNFGTPSDHVKFWQTRRISRDP